KVVSSSERALGARRRLEAADHGYAGAARRAQPWIMAIQLESGLSPVVSAGKGVFAGAAGTAVMTLAQTKLWPPKVLEKIPSGYRPKPSRFPSNREEPVTEVVARRFVEGVLRRPRRGRAQRWAGPLTPAG